jgi:hypothetical protein
MKSDMSITVIYHAISLTVIYTYLSTEVKYSNKLNIVMYKFCNKESGKYSVFVPICKFTEFWLLHVGNWQICSWQTQLTNSWKWIGNNWTGGHIGSGHWSDEDKWNGITFCDNFAGFEQILYW